MNSIRRWTELGVALGLGIALGAALGVGAERLAYSRGTTFSEYTFLMVLAKSAVMVTPVTALFGAGVGWLAGLRGRPA